jgi:hypothetical protein
MKDVQASEMKTWFPPPAVTTASLQQTIGQTMVHVWELMSDEITNLLQLATKKFRVSPLHPWHP